MKLSLAVMLLLGLLVVGLGLWTALPQGGGGLGQEGAPGETAATPPEDRSEGTVEIRRESFEPRDVESLGQATVTFLNRDDRSRRIEFADERIRDSPRIAPGGTFVARMPGKGRFRYADAEERSMRGTVVVPAR